MVARGIGRSGLLGGESEPGLCVCVATVAAGVGIVARIGGKEWGGKDTAAKGRVRILATSSAFGLAQQQADGFVLVGVVGLCYSTRSRG